MSQELRETSEKIFNLFDKDNSGFIDENELYSALKDLCDAMEYNQIPTKEEAQEVLKKMDKNKDGSIDFKEFFCIIKKLIKSC